MSRRFGFTVQGRAVPQGSLRAMKLKTGAVVTPQEPKVLKWRSDVRAGLYAREGAMQPTAEAFHVEMTFCFRRPNNHHTSKGNLTTRAPRYHMQHPDVDKLIRAVLDALTGVVWHDDKQVVYVRGHKQWSEQDEATFTIYTLEEPHA
jgi:crossover junction endodeoxyribonuclease RusA